MPTLPLPTRPLRHLARRFGATIAAGCSSLILASAIGQTTPPAADAVDALVRAAVAAGDWTRTAVLLADVTPDTRSPVCRLLKAHACLAINRNNEAACLFLATTNPADLATWHAWTRDWPNPPPTLLYLQADASARLGNLAEADLLLTGLLRQPPPSALALNARGVVRASQGKFTAALADFEAAMTAAPHLADAASNAAFTAIDQHEGARAAVDDFTRALRDSPDFALALYGRGCLRLVLHQWDRAETDLTRAAEISPCQAAWVSAAIDDARRTAQAAMSELAAADPDKPGMSLNSKLEQYRAGDWGFRGANLTRDFQNYAKDPVALTKIYGAAREAVAKDPAKAAYLDTYWKNTQSAHQNVGVLDRVSQTVSGGLSGGVGAHARVGNGKSYVEAGPNLSGTLGYSRTTDQSFPGRNLDWKQKTIGYETANRMIEAKYGKDPSGFDTAQRDAITDAGNWEYRTQYGLFLPRPAQPSAPTALRLVQP